MPKQNCWEFKKCGRQPAGPKAAELGVCPASIERRTSGVNGGSQGGRACWALTGTLCGARVQGTFASKLVSCQKCEFYEVVRREEGAAFVGANSILTLVK